MHTSYLSLSACVCVRACSRWFTGDVTTASGGSLIEAGVVWMENPDGHTGRLLQEPSPLDRSRRLDKLTMWEDNEASWHQDFGGFA